MARILKSVAPGGEFEYHDVDACTDSSCRICLEWGGTVPLLSEDEREQFAKFSDAIRDANDLAVAMQECLLVPVPLPKLEEHMAEAIREHNSKQETILLPLAITPQMLEAGAKEIAWFNPGFDSPEVWAGIVFHAMVKAGRIIPVSSVPEGNS